MVERPGLLSSTSFLPLLLPCEEALSPVAFSLLHALQASFSKTLDVCLASAETNQKQQLAPNSIRSPTKLHPLGKKRNNQEWVESLAHVVKK